MPKPKRHHYVPESYSKAFCNEDGFLWLFDKWEHTARALKPKNALVIGHLYRQPVHEEGRFDSAIEDFFATTADNDWPILREAIDKKEKLNQDQWGRLVEFICSQLVRVPLSMNSVIELLREAALVTSKQAGPIPEPLIAEYRKITGRDPKDLDELVERGVVDLKIDPHRSITSMPFLVRNVPLFQPGFSFGIPKFLHNETDLEFISSDNPVVFHAGKHGASVENPYLVESDRNFSFCFPISPRIALVNDTFDSKRSMHCAVRDRNKVAAINRTVARFSYRFILSKSQRLAENYGNRFSNICPRPALKTSQVIDGHVLRIGYNFGKPLQLLNSWKYDFEDALPGVEPVREVTDEG